eukprot:1158152-Pelagomonas_calceolata.AAC.3
MPKLGARPRHCTQLDLACVVFSFLSWEAAARLVAAAEAGRVGRGADATYAAAATTRATHKPPQAPKLKVSVVGVNNHATVTSLVLTTQAHTPCRGGGTSGSEVATHPRATNPGGGTGSHRATPSTADHTQVNAEGQAMRPLPGARTATGVLRMAIVCVWVCARVGVAGWLNGLASTAAGSACWMAEPEVQATTESLRQSRPHSNIHCRINQSIPYRCPRLIKHTHSTHRGAWLPGATTSPRATYPDGGRGRHTVRPRMCATGSTPPRPAPPAAAFWEAEEDGAGRNWPPWPAPASLSLAWMLELLVLVGQLLHRRSNTSQRRRGWSMGGTARGCMTWCWSCKGHTKVTAAGVSANGDNSSKVPPRAVA